MTRRVGCAMALFMVALGGWHAPVARAAGTFTVFSCVAPRGGTAPAGDDRYGWRPRATTFGRTSDCGVEIDANQVAGAVPVGEHARVDFVTPPGTVITHWRLVLGGFVQHPDTTLQTAPEVDLVGTSSATAGLRWLGTGPVPVNWTSGGRLTLEHNGVEGGLSLVARCSGPAGSHCTNGSDPATRLSPWLALFGLSSRITLLDNASPTASATGPAIDDAAWLGTESLAWHGTDQGGGIYRLGVEVDGRKAMYLPGPDNGGRCADADTTNADPREFLLPVPCQLSASATAAIDTTKLPNGTHTIRLFVEDAGGNEATVFGPARKEIANDFRLRGFFAAGRFFNPQLSTPRAVNGAHGGEGARVVASLVRGRRGARTARVGFGERARIRGSVRNAAGVPIGHALLYRAERIVGGQWRIDGSVRSRKDGTFGLRLPARLPSRDVRLVYFPFSDSHDNVRSNRLALRVRAGLTIAVDRHRARNEGRIVFTGRVRGPVPARGVSVSLQAKVGARYQTFRELRASSLSKGRLRTVYRFRNTHATVRYRFRFELLKQAGLPFDTGRSNIVSVLVRP